MVTYRKLKPRHPPLLLDERKNIERTGTYGFDLLSCFDYIIVLVIGSQTEVNQSCLMMCRSLAWLVKGCE